MFGILLNSDSTFEMVFHTFNGHSHNMFNVQQCQTTDLCIELCKNYDQKEFLN